MKKKLRTLQVNKPEQKEVSYQTKSRRKSKDRLGGDDENKGSLVFSTIQT